MATVPAEFNGPSDADLIDAVRKGNVSAYGKLYERHAASAYTLARQLAGSPAEQDDLVSEAFEKVLATLRAGRGPDSAFRAYLLTALRHTAYDKTRRDRKLELHGDGGEINPAAMSEPFVDTAVARLERTLAARAFAQLPERWQTVLWHTVIEGQTPADVAPILGLNPHGVSALAYRAREGLKQAYLQAHLAEAGEPRCRATAERLGAWTRAGLSKRERAQVEAHLDECERCRMLAAELKDVNGALGAVVAPLVLGSVAAGYLAAIGGTDAAAAAKAAVPGGVAAVGASTAAAATDGEGAAGARASLSRQLLGITASAVALAAAVVVGLSVAGENNEAPPNVSTTPGVPAPPPVAPSMPGAPPTSSAPAPAGTPSAPTGR